MEIIICAEEEFPSENEVLILDGDSFDKALKKYEFLLVFFYASWSEESKKIIPEYEKAATTLKKENLFLSKVEGTTQKILSERYQIHGYPTIKLFIDGQPIEDFKGSKELEIVQWMREKTRINIKSLQNSQQVENFKKYNEVCIIYFGSNKTDIEELNKAARKFKDIPFALVNSNDVINKYTKAGTIVLFKHFDEKKNEITKINVNDISDFINKYSFPRVMFFNKKTAKIIFVKHHPSLILYVEKDSDKWREYEKLLNKLSEKLLGKLKLVLSDYKTGVEIKMANYIGVEKEDLPTARIVDTKLNLKKYKMESVINENNILKFVEDWEKDKLKPYLKSSEEPKENNGDVRILISKTFEKEVINNDKDVMILFYAPWCIHCEEFNPIYEKVAKSLKEKNQKLLMAKIDSSKNEIESLIIRGFPTIKFYPGNKKNKEPIDYIGERTVDGIINFIKENAYNKIIYDEGVKKEEMIKSIIANKTTDL